MPDAPVEGRSMGCDDCGRTGDGLFDFLVSTGIWNRVMSGGVNTESTGEGIGGVVCLPCFDLRARALAIDYQEHLLPFGASCWMGGNYTGRFDPETGYLPGTAIHARAELDNLQQRLSELEGVLKRMVNDHDHGDNCDRDCAIHMTALASAALRSRVTLGAGADGDHGRSGTDQRS